MDAPIENGVQAARRAREGLTAGGDLANAGYTYPTVAGLLDCAPSLDAYVAELLPAPRELVAQAVVTVSVGVAATIPERPGTWHQLVESADAELYRAKRAGRNRVHAPSP